MVRGPGKGAGSFWMPEEDIVCPDGNEQVHENESRNSAVTGVFSVQILLPAVRYMYT